jgi:hypothetical protein
MRKFLIAGAVLALSACGGGGNESDEANNLSTDNMLLEQNMMLDQNANLDSINGMEANGALDSNTANAIIEDSTTNDSDTNLANGM